MQAGGLSGFQSLSVALVSESKMTTIEAINIVIGSWIVGAVVMPEYTRFAKKTWVAIAIPFIVLIIAQWFLQILGALGGVVSNDSLFSAFLGVDLNILMKEGVIIGWIGIIGMSLALWTTGDANLYLPVIQTSSILKRPKNVMTVICGILGTILGLGLYQYFFTFLALLASIVPPLIGPVIIEYFLIDKAKFHSSSFEGLVSWNPPAFIAYIAGAASTYFSPNFIMPALTGLITSMIVYWIIRKAVK